MEQPTNEQIKAEALDYLAWYDADPSDTYHARTADAIADFLLESRFAEVDDDCDWPEDFCDLYFDTVKATLVAAGVPEI